MLKLLLTNMRICKNIEKNVKKTFILNICAYIAVSVITIIATQSSYFESTATRKNHQVKSAPDNGALIFISTVFYQSDLGRFHYPDGLKLILVSPFRAARVPDIGSFPAVIRRVMQSAERIYPRGVKRKSKFVFAGA